MKPSLTVRAHVNVLGGDIKYNVVPLNAAPLHPYISRACPLRLILILILPSLLFAQTHGTAILIIRTRDQIVVAADSAVSGNGIAKGSVCKIRPFGKMFVVVNGFTESPPTCYNAIKALDGFSPKGSVDAVEGTIKSQLEYTLTQMRRTRPDDFQKAVESPLGLTFIGLKDNELTMMGSRFAIAEIQDPIRIQIQRRACPGADCFIDQVGLIYVGPNRVFQELRRERPNFWYDPDLTAVARRFVQMQIDANLPDVGGPIDVLRITKSGAEWIQHKKECLDIQSATPKPAPKPTRRKRKRG